MTLEHFRSYSPASVGSAAAASASLTQSDAPRFPNSRSTDARNSTSIASFSWPPCPGNNTPTVVAVPVAAEVWECDLWHGEGSIKSQIFRWYMQRYSGGGNSVSSADAALTASVALCDDV